MAKSRSRSQTRSGKSGDTPQWTVQPGTAVYGSDDRKIGGVKDIQGSDLIVHKGGLFARDIPVPFALIVAHTDDRIDLSVPADEAARSHDSQSVAAEARSGDNETSGTDSLVIDTTTDEIMDTTEVIRIPVVEEQLEASRHQVERGAVHLETVVTEREDTLDVRVTEERVRIQRVPADRLATAADLSANGQILDVAVYGEDVDVHTRARVVEEVVISKDAIQEIREVSGTVHREDVDVVDNTLTRDQMVPETVDPTTNRDPSPRP